MKKRTWKNTAAAGVAILMAASAATADDRWDTMGSDPIVSLFASCQECCAVIESAYAER